MGRRAAPGAEGAKIAHPARDGSCRNNNNNHNNDNDNDIDNDNDNDNDIDIDNDNGNNNIDKIRHNRHGPTSVAPCPGSARGRNQSAKN